MWTKIKLRITSCIALILLSLSVILFSCNKEWLEAKPDKALALPNTVKDLQSLLDQTNNVVQFNGLQNALDEQFAGDFYVTDNTWNSASLIERKAYTWAPDDLATDKGSNPEWNGAYERIFYTNVILERIEKITASTPNELKEWNQVKGSALFFRAYNFFDIARQFCKPFVKTTANTDLGIPLRLEADFNIPSVRSTVAETYGRILQDLKESALILPVATPISDLYKCRPTRSAAHALLARVYLSMCEYDSAFLYADLTLQSYNTLLDYNIQTPTATASSISSSTTSSSTIARFNNEVIFHRVAYSWGMSLTSSMIVTPELLNLYSNSDLRVHAFFRVHASGNIVFRGSYDGSTTFFGGLTAGETLLIRAECYARQNEVGLALADLNTLYRKRWNNASGAYQNITAANSNEALKKILLERRKELCFRTVRWTDLRRLNQDPDLAVTLARIINGQTYTLPPNSPLYVFPIPDNVIQFTGMPQNPR